jgi:hypothetical protein
MRQPAEHRPSLDSERAPWERWLRSGVATFLVGSTAVTAHLAALVVVACAASGFCLANAWRSYRAEKLWRAVTPAIPATPAPAA